MIGLPVYNIDGNKIYEGSTTSGLAVYNIDGNKIYAGSSTSGLAVYNIDGNKIYEGSTTSGLAVYNIDGNKIYAGSTTSGLPVYIIDGNKIYAGSGASDSGSSSSYSDSGSGGEKPGCMGRIISFFITTFIKSSLGGKIGGIAFFVFMTAYGLTSGDGIVGTIINALLLGFLLGISAGTFIGFILRKLSRTGKFCAAISSGVFGLLFGIISRVGDDPRWISAHNTIIMTSAGLFIGCIVGIVIGAIVTLIQKRKGKV